MRTPSLTVRAVALVAAAAVSVTTAGPVFGHAAGRRPCQEMAAGEACARAAAGASCCCADADPATPADRPATTGTTPVSVQFQAATGWSPVLVLMPLAAAAAPVHGYQSVRLHTLHSTLLI